MIKEDLIECVIGLGPNLFYNSPMESCLLITKNNKSKDRKGKILFINAINEVKQQSSMGYLEDKHIDSIFKAYKNFKNKKNLSALVDNKDVLLNNGNMTLSLYVQPQKNSENNLSFESLFSLWNKSNETHKEMMNNLFKNL